MKQSEIRSFIASYHRNGISGNGFYLCSFRIFQNKDSVHLRAVIFQDKGNIAVFSDNCAQKWRGDEFESVLREAIRLQEQNQPMRAHEQLWDLNPHKNNEN